MAKTIFRFRFQFQFHLQTQNIVISILFLFAKCTLGTYMQIHTNPYRCHAECKCRKNEKTQHTYTASSRLNLFQLHFERPFDLFRSLFDSQNLLLSSIKCVFHINYVFWIRKTLFLSLGSFRREKHSLYYLQFLIRWEALDDDAGTHLNAQNIILFILFAFITFLLRCQM